jgi:hypothetical protein
MSGSVGHFATVDDSDDAGWYIRFMDTSNAQPDRTATRAFLRYWVDHHHRQGWSGRQLRRRFTVKGLTDVTVTPRTVLPSYELFRTVMAGPLTEAVAAGVVDVSPDEWWAPLAEAAAAGHFFGSMTGIVLGATR